MKQGHLFGKEQGTGIAKKCEGKLRSRDVHILSRNVL